MSPRIERIEDAGPDRKARRLVFDDGSEPRLTSAAVVKELAIEEGALYPGDELETSLAGVEPQFAKDRALRLLGYRERSCAELTRKLKDSGYGPQVAGAVVSRFVELGLVDDERFAGMWVRSRVSAGRGGRRIRQELAEKGIAPEIIAAAMADSCPPDEQLQRACDALRGRSASDRKERDRLIRRLVARGFDLSVARRAVESVSEAAESGDFN